jgi:hypothetical protein
MNQFVEIVKVKDFGLALVMTALGIAMVEFFRWQIGTAPVIIFIVPLVYISYVGGLAAGGLAAISFGVYVHLFGSTNDPTNAILVNGVTLAVVVLLNWLIYDAKVQAFNGSFQKMLDALSAIRRLKRDWERMSDEERLTEIFLIEDRLGNSAANIIGWRELRNQTEAAKRSVIDSK